MQIKVIEEGHFNSPQRVQWAWKIQKIQQSSSSDPRILCATIASAKDYSSTVLYGVMFK